MEIDKIPVVLTSQALNSLRDSGFSLSAAIGEVIDNSLEAGANNIRIRMDEAPAVGRGKKSRVHRLCFADDGSGMDDTTLHRYPQIGFSTRYMRTDTIGKYGVGAKFAALNFGKRIDVWSRTDPTGPWRHIHFDLDEALEEEAKGNREALFIVPPDNETVPSDLAELLPTGSGTLVVWSKVDRLEDGRQAKDFNTLRLEAEKEISRIFRVFLNDGRNIEVNGTKLLPHDPLFLMRGTWAEQQLTEYYKPGGAGEKLGIAISPADFEAEVIVIEPIKVGGHEAHLTITLYPRAVTRKKGMGGDNLAKTLRVPDNEGCISFMRMDREISYTNVPRIFGRRVDDPDRFIGIEVSFKPDLDDYFGVRNVKRGAEPHDELREKIRSLVIPNVRTARTRLDEQWGKVAQEQKEHKGEHKLIVEVATEAAKTLPVPQAKSDLDATQVYDDLAEDVLGPTASKDAKDEYIHEVKDLPFVVESVSMAGKQFIEIQHINKNVIIRINTRHRFYRDMWQPLSEVAYADAATLNTDQAHQAAKRAVETLTLLIISYGRAESMHNDPHEQYEQLRDYWGIFLDSLLSKVKGVL